MWSGRPTHGSRRSLSIPDASLALVTRRAWPELSWDHILAKAGTSADFVKHMNTAKEAMSKLDAVIQQERPFVLQNVEERASCQIAMSRTFWFISDTDFEALYALKPAKCGLKSEVIKNEVGAEVSGIILRDGSWPWRTLTVSHEGSCDLKQQLHNPDVQLREDQGKDLATQHLATSLKQRPPSLLAKSVMTLAEMEAKVEATKCEKLPEQEEEPATPAPLRAEAAEEEPEPAEDDDIAVPNEALQKTAPALRIEEKQKKRKRMIGKSKPGAQREERTGAGQSGLKNRRTAAFVADEVGSVAAGGAGSSSARSRSPRPSTSRGSGKGSNGSSGPKERAEWLKGQGEKYMKILTVDKVLSGESFGNDFNQANRIWRAQDKIPKLAAEAVALKAHISTIEAAKLVHPDSIYKLTKAERHKTIAEIWPAIEKVPPNWAVAVLECRIRDWVAESVPASEVDDYVDSVSPFAPPSGHPCHA